MRDLVRFILLPALIGGVVGLAIVLGYMLQSDSKAPAPKPGYAAAVRVAGPAVVNIRSTKLLRHPICELPRYRDWCNRFSEQRRQGALGSGVVVHASGYILTSHHVIRDADEILVGFADGRTTIATLVGADPDTDLAVIRVPFNDLTPIKLGSSDAAEVGDVVLAIGNPFGVGQTVSAGIVSAKGRAAISESPYDDFIQTDAAINPGNSGGALIDTAGNLLGINTLIFTRSGDSAGIGFAIPAQLAYQVLEEIIETGRVTRGWLGVVMANSPPPGSAVGLAIVSIEPGGPAASAGLIPGDLVLAVRNQPASSSAVVSREIGRTRPGEPIDISAMRNGRQFSVAVVAGERPVIQP